MSLDRYSINQLSEGLVEEYMISVPHRQKMKHFKYFITKLWNTCTCICCRIRKILKKKLHLTHKYATHLDPVAINRHNMFMNKEVFLFGHRFLFLTKTSSVMQIVIICLWLCPNLFFNKSRCGLSLFSSSGLWYSKLLYF